jgi:trimethylamine--corrinoid protein Co-methyltransferase
LENVGLEVNNLRARDIFRRNGCRIDEERLRVTSPGRVVERFLQQVPSNFTFLARHPNFDRTIPDDAPLTMNASSAPNLIDPATKQERRATSDDIARTAQLVNELPGVDLFSISVLADDAPPGHYSLARFYTAQKHCRKPIAEPVVNSQFADARQARRNDRVDSDKHFASDGGVICNSSAGLGYRVLPVKTKVCEPERRMCHSESSFGQ